MANVNKVTTGIGVVLFLLFAAKLTKVAIEQTSDKSDKIAEKAVKELNKADIELDEAFESLVATKDPNGAGVLMTYTFKDGYGFTHDIPDAEFRKLFIHSAGRWRLKPLIKENVYIILRFMNHANELQKKVIISPSNFYDRR